MTETAETPTKPRNPSVWTPEQARAFSVKAQEARRRIRAEREAKLNSPPVEPETQQPINLPPDPFASQRLSRIRKQLIHLDKMLAESCDTPSFIPCPKCGERVCTEVDATHIDKLASAISRLSEIERQLADRPLPGSRRPAATEAPTSRAAALLAAPQSGKPKVRAEQE